MIYWWKYEDKEDMNANNKVPIYIVKDTIRLDSEKMEIGKFYPIRYLGNKYIFNKTEDGIIDIYVEE